MAKVRLHMYRPMGREGERLGKATEAKFLSGCEELRQKGEYPLWLFYFESATEEQDKEGVDAWAYTDVGKIPIQIKRSSEERTHFLRRENRKHIMCVAVTPLTPFIRIFDFTLSQLAQKRRSILAQKKTAPV